MLKISLKAVLWEFLTSRLIMQKLFQINCFIYWTSICDGFFSYPLQFSVEFYEKNIPLRLLMEVIGFGFVILEVHEEVVFVFCVGK